MIPAIEIDERYLVRDSGTSDGTQIKYFKDNKWYKVDRYGGEAISDDNEVSQVFKGLINPL